MNREDIIRLAREADCGWTRNGTEPLLMGESQIQRFAALVAAHEREACARVCDDFESNNKWSDAHGYDHVFAAAIRERGEEPKRHPGYIIGDHWLQAAYTRICTGETEDEVMTDYGWQRARGEK